MHWLTERLQQLWDGSPMPRYAATFPFYLAGHLVLLAAGVIGFVGDPSPNVARLGPLPLVLWSILLLLGGGASAVARVRGQILLEAASSQFLSLAFFVWGGAILLGPALGYQSGLAFCGIALLMIAWVRSARVYVSAHRLAAVQQAKYDSVAELAAARIEQLERAWREETGTEPPPFPLHIGEDGPRG